MYNLSNQDYEELKEIIDKHFNITNQSPYSYSIYNSMDIGWDHKPEGSYRIADHWNFNGHCETWNKVENTTHLSVGIFRNGKYEIIKSFEKLYNYSVTKLYKGFRVIDNQLIETYGIEVAFDRHNIMQDSEAFMFSTDYGKRKKDIIKSYIIIEGNHLSLENPDIECFIKSYDGTLKTKVNKICNDRRTKSSTKLDKLKNLGEIVEIINDDWSEVYDFLA